MKKFFKSIIDFLIAYGEFRAKKYHRFGWY